MEGQGHYHPKWNPHPVERRRHCACSQPIRPPKMGKAQDRPLRALHLERLKRYERFLACTTNPTPRQNHMNLFIDSKGWIVSKHDTPLFDGKMQKLLRCTKPLSRWPSHWPAHTSASRHFRSFLPESLLVNFMFANTLCAAEGTAGKSSFSPEINDFPRLRYVSQLTYGAEKSLGCHMVFPF